MKTDIPFLEVDKTVEESETTTETWLDHADISWTGNGIESDPYIIDTAEKLAGISYTVKNKISIEGKYFKQTKNINLGGYQWIAIGDFWEQNRNFNANYDGSGYSISGLYILSSKYFQGLFGYVAHCTIKNIVLKDSYIKTSYTETSGGGNVGSIAGTADLGASIENCQSNASIDGFSNVGGIVGNGNGATIKNCSFTGRSFAKTDMAGGIAGSAKNCNISSCSNTGYISAGANYVGGITGRIFTEDSGEAKIENCINSGNIRLTGETSTDNGSGWDAGGIAGFCKNSVISKCLSSGVVDSFRSHAGGIVGQCQGEKSKILDCFATGQLLYDWDAVNHHIGAIVGYTSTNIVVSNCVFIGSCLQGNIEIVRREDCSPSVTNCYAIINDRGYYTDGNYDDFSVVPKINDGYPIQKSLYHIAEYGESVSANWFASKNFIKV